MTDKHIEIKLMPGVKAKIVGREILISFTENKVKKYFENTEFKKFVEYEGRYLSSSSEVIDKTIQISSQIEELLLPYLNGANVIRADFNNKDSFDNNLSGRLFSIIENEINQSNIFDFKKLAKIESLSFIEDLKTYENVTYEEASVLTCSQLNVFCEQLAPENLSVKINVN